MCGKIFSTRNPICYRMSTVFLKKQQLFIFVLLTFIAFIIIDTIIKFYYFYFLNYESNIFSFISFIVPYAILISIVLIYSYVQQNIGQEERDFVSAQLRHKGLPVRRRIRVFKIKKKVKRR